ncbi:MAG: BA14K family protein [Pseudomonadota bacterium]|nr:BA14K family protein [Pseudomonadota bacterium]
MSLFARYRAKFAAAALAATIGAGALLSAQPAQAGDAFVAGMLGGFIGANVLQPVYPVPVYPGPYYAGPAYPVYAGPPVIVHQPPVVIYEEPVYAEPVYAPHHRRRSLAAYDRYPPRHGAPAPSGDPRVVTYDDTVGGARVAGAEPWSPGWFDYCRSKFRSFDDRTGTFLGYDGNRHFCTVK